MAVRGFLALLLILMSGIVHADDMTSPLPSTTELKTANLPPVIQTTPSASSTSRPSSTSTHSTLTTEPAAKTTTAHTTVTTTAPTTTQSTTSSSTKTTVTTSAPTTTQSTTSSSTKTTVTTSAPTTSSSTKTTVTTLAPTTAGHNTTNSTTEPPTTTGHNMTNSTTDAPTTTHTNATGAPTPPPTTPPVPNPTVGNYSVKTDNVSDCLLAKMGLQFSFKISGNASLQTVNFDPSPNVTKVSGTCGSGGSESSLLLTSKDITVHFVFTNVSQKFHLHALTLSVDLGNGNLFNDSNTNLSLWEASVGSSYMCRKEQSYNISDKLTLNTFELQVQPFDVKKNMFSTAHECSLDDTSLLIPIIVGAALAGLIFIVVIAYMIGRRRTYVGYQTL